MCSFFDDAIIQIIIQLTIQSEKKQLEIKNVPKHLKINGFKLINRKAYFFE